MQAVILAAGASSRFWPLNDMHKSLVRITGKPIIQHTIENLIKAGIDQIIVVQGSERDVEKIIGNKIGDARINYVIQKEPLGMGNALYQAKELLEEQFFVLNPEHFFTHELIEDLLNRQVDGGSPVVLLGKKTDMPWLYGILKLDGDRAVDLVEKPTQGEEPSNIKVAGIYLLPKEFFEYYDRVEKHMYDYEDALKLYMKEKDVRVIITDRDLPTLKYPWHILDITRLKLLEIKGREIDESVEISDSAVIKGPVHIGKNTKIMNHAVIKGPVWIGDNCIIGDHALIRDYTDIENNCIVGAHSEIARSVLQEGVHIHSGFVGDSVIGKNTRIGAGIVTANVRLDRNYIKVVVKNKGVDTKVKSLGTIVGSDVRIGINVSIMPGILIGRDSIIGPHTIVRENVPDNTLFYSKFESIIRKRLK
ncbi:MAG: NTP transferase domain-containing protein [Candidatus Aenigmarchaeota archaeon]|nr:NTP transferase domain-containing protein [Candidatus Aenigmarchaeota archaeon]